MENIAIRLEAIATRSKKLLVPFKLVEVFCGQPGEFHGFTEVEWPFGAEIKDYKRFG